MTNFLPFLPESVSLATIVALLALTLADDRTGKRWAMPVNLTAGVLLLVACGMSLFTRETFFYSTYSVDALSQGFKLLIACGLFIALLLNRESESIPASRAQEFRLFLWTGSLGMMMLTSAADLLTLYVSLELSSYSLYLLSSVRQDHKNAEASLKYLIFGAATSGFMLWGFSILAGLAGTTSLAGIAGMAPSLASQGAFILAMVFVSFAFLFKLSGFPAQFWAPDVYQSSATPVTAFIATASKAAGVAIFIRIFHLVGVLPSLSGIFAILAFISMTVGNSAALLQKDVKRLLAYSSIAQAGYLLIGLLADSSQGYSSSYFYAMAYVLMNAGAFLVVVVVARQIKNDNPQITDFDGLADKSPQLALLLLLSTLSLAGIPPLVGFTGKWILFSAAMDKGHWFLVLWAVLNSVVSLFYYLALVKHAYLGKPKSVGILSLGFSANALCFFLIATLILLGIFPDVFIQYAQQAIG